MAGQGRGSGGESLNRRGRGELPQRTQEKATPILMRLAELDEAVAIAGVLHQSFLEYKSLYTEGGFAATTPAAEQISVRMQEGPVWVALCAAEIVGTVSAVRTGASVYLRGMAIAPTARGSGAGSGLLQHVEQWARRQGALRLFLSTTPFLDAAICLYEQSGFVRTDEGPNDLFGTPLFTMEKKISGTE